MKDESELDGAQKLELKQCNNYGGYEVAMKRISDQAACLIRRIHTCSHSHKFFNF